MRTDKLVIRCVVIAVATVAVVSLLGNAALVVAHRGAEAFFTHAFDVSFGVLAGLLAKTSTADDDLRTLAAATPGPPGPAGPAGITAPPLPRNPSARSGG